MMLTVLFMSSTYTFETAEKKGILVYIITLSIEKVPLSKCVITAKCIFFK